MNDLLFSLVTVLVGTIVMTTHLHRYRRIEGQLLMISFGAHITAAVAQVWVSRYYYHGIADMLSYYLGGLSLTGAMSRDFGGVAPEVVRLILQLPSHPGVQVVGSGTSTGTMAGLASMILLVVNDSVYATCIVIGFASFSGKLAIYTVFREVWPERYHTRLLTATMLVPTVVFWSCGITKEAFALTGLGYMFLGLHRVIGHRPRWAIVVALGGLMVGLVKAYILLPFVVGGSLWFYWTRAMPADGDLKIKPVYLFLGAFAAIFGVLALGWMFPRFAITTVSHEAARLQGVGPTVEGGSNYSIGDERAQSVVGQLTFAPFALLTALFRPTIFDVRNAMMFLNSIEASTITALVLWTLWTRRWAWMWRMVIRSPTMMFCFVFTIILGMGVGLSSMNLGTLSRYRMPMMPFYVALVLVWSAPALQTHRTAADGRAQGPAGRFKPKRLPAGEPKPGPAL